MEQEMRIKQTIYNIKLFPSVKHSPWLIHYSIVRPSRLLYNAVQSIVLKSPIFTRKYEVIKRINKFVRCKMSDRKNIVVRILDGYESIVDACALLHKVYFEEAVWRFSLENPSKLRAEIRNNKSVLVDRFTENAVWFGAFDDSELVGCVRLTFVDENNKLEVEGYESSIAIQSYLPKDKSHCVEMTRAAILKSHNGLGILRDLFLAAFQYCEDNQYSVCAFPSNRYIIAVFTQMGWPLKMEYVFKYEEQDPAPVSFYFADYSKLEIKNMILNLEHYKKKVNINNMKIFDALEIVAPTLPTPVYWHDIEGVVLGINSLCLKAIGATREIVGKTPHEFYPKEIADHILSHNEQVIKTGEILSQDEPMRDIVTGEVKVFRSVKSPLYDDEGKIIGIIGSSIDVTAEKEAEKTLRLAKEAAEAANQAKTEFVQNMQHDIRTPSSGLWGVLDVLAKTEPDKDRKEALQMAVAASKRLLDLCNDAVNFGDLDKNTRPMVERDLDLRELVKSVIELNKPAAFAKKIAVHLTIDSAVPPHIASDEFRISRILINLLGNAIKFSHQGKITLNITASLEEETRKGVLTIKIRDTGIGIPRDKVEKIFEKFTRGVASNTNKYPGTGLGLYVVKTFIDELEGDIYVDSQENEGSYFKLDIPFKGLLADMKKPGLKIDEYFDASFKERPEQKQDIELRHKKESSESTPFSHELLIIEDDKTCLFAEKNLLSGYTNKIDSAENVADALKKLAAKRYDLVISDLGLPDGSGNDIVAKIKSNPESPNYKTPFVAMTAHQDAEKHKRAMEAGFTETNTKPLGVDKAVELLKSYPAQGDEPENEEEGVAVIDLALGMQRIGAKTESAAIEALSILYETLQEDMPALKEAEKNNDIEGAREVLHKIRGGLCYSGTPRLEEAIKLLHTDVKCTPELSKIGDLFTLVYHETNLFVEQFKELVGITKN
jgi:two-component system aerobic respiration control sensor histidine kinase ArcB